MAPSGLSRNRTNQMDVIFGVLLLSSLTVPAFLYQFHLCLKFRSEMESGQRNGTHYQKWKVAQASLDDELDGRLTRQFVPCVHRELTWTHPLSCFWGPVGSCCQDTDDSQALKATGGLIYLWLLPISEDFLSIMMGILAASIATAVMGAILLCWLVRFLSYAFAGIRNAVYFRNLVCLRDISLHVPAFGNSRPNWAQ